MTTSLKAALMTAAAALPLLLGACSSKGAGEAIHHGRHAAEAFSQADYAEGYRMGEEMATTCVDSVDVQAWLLDFHARTSEAGTEKCADLRLGFRDAVEDHAPEMAATIFN